MAGSTLVQPASPPTRTVLASPGVAINNPNMVDNWYRRTRVMHLCLSKPAIAPWLSYIITTRYKQHLQHPWTATRSSSCLSESSRLHVLANIVLHVLMQCVVPALPLAWELLLEVTSGAHHVMRRIGNDKYDTRTRVGRSYMSMY